MSIDPAPFLSVGDVSVSTVPPGAAGGLTGVDSLRVTWGRSSLLDQPTPATCALTVLDTTDGATFARRTDLKGREVQVGYGLGVNESGEPQVGYTFRGRVTDVAARPRRAGGFLVSLSASSKEVDAANYTAAEGTTWPQETMGARLARIVGLLPAGLFAGGVQLPTRAAVGLPAAAIDFADYPVAPADVGGQDVLSLLRGLWRSTFPLPLIYNPAEDALTFIRSRRHYVDATAHGSVVGQLLADPNRGGRYVPAPFATLGLSLDAAEVEFTGALSQPLEAAATRVEVTYWNPAATDRATTTAAVPGAPAEATSGRRTLAVESLLAAADLAAELAGHWATIAAEAAQPALHDPIVYRPRGGFADDTAAGVLLAGRERPAELFVGRSWLTRLGARPVLALLGGTITYSGGEWELSLHTAPVTVDGPTAAPLTAATIAATAAVTLADLDPSLSVGDLAHVQIGAGRTYSTQPWGP